MTVTFNKSYVMAFMVTTACAAIFNLLVLLVICFDIGPHLEETADVAKKNYETVKQNSIAFKINWQSATFFSDYASGAASRLRMPFAS